MNPIDKILIQANGWVEWARNFINAHKRQTAAVIGALFVCATSVSLAVSSPMSFSSSKESSITQDVISLLSKKSGDTEQNDLATLYRSGYTQLDNTADSLLLSLGVTDANAANFLRTTPLTQQHLLNSKNRLVLVKVDANQMDLDELTELWVDAKNDKVFNKLVVKRIADGQFEANLTQGLVKVSQQMTTGVINSTLYEATQAARVPYKVAAQLQQIFSSKINFQSDLRAGARFTLVYQALEGDGQPLQAGRILGAELVNNGEAYHAIWYEPQNNTQRQHQVASNKGGYYSLSGDNLTGHRFLSTPVRYARISSPFGERFDPYLRQWHFHGGIDLAAPTGASIHAVGQGVVEFAGVQRGYGNVVIVRHANKISTLYAHMKKINVRYGQHVAEGQVIGFVGETGWATGPHLHFEFRDDGVHKNPLVAVRKYAAVPLAANQRARFDRLALAMRQQLQEATAKAAVSNNESDYFS